MSTEKVSKNPLTSEDATPSDESARTPSSTRSFSSSFSSLPAVPCRWLPAFHGRVLQGSCGWTDASILKGRHFYPSHVHTAVERLRHYSSFFPCVEVDSSNYAIPPAHRVASWVAVTPPSFLFHFKIYGLFTSLNIRSDAIPGPLRDHLPSSLSSSASTIQLSALPPSFTSLLWDYWNAAVLPAHTAEKMGLIVFQFHLGFSPTPDHRRHVEWCRQRLWGGYRMAVEFRDRRWVDEAHLEETRKWLASLDVSFVCEDDLAQETYRPNKEKVGEDHRLPIIYTPTSTHSLYIRLHRRVGDNRGDRVLAPHEFTEWVTRLKEARKELGGGERVQFFMWGTDCWDDPIVNSRHLDRGLKGDADLWLDWAEMQKERRRGQGGGNLLALFQKQTQKKEGDGASKEDTGDGKEEAEEAEEEKVRVGEGKEDEDEVDVIEAPTPTSRPVPQQKRERAVEAFGSAGPASKKQRTQASPSRGPKGKPTAKDRASPAGPKISAFFSQVPR